MVVCVSQSLMRDIGILLVIGVLGALVFVLNVKLVGKTRWGGL